MGVEACIKLQVFTPLALKQKNHKQKHHLCRRYPSKYILKLLGKKIKKGQSTFLDLEIARLHTRTAVKVPVIVNRAEKDGPVLLLMAGVHGDEVNGVAIIREIIKHQYHIPQRGTIICIPVLNVFGYLNQERVFPDGRDLNRMFPGSANGSLASQFAYAFRKEIAPYADYVIDFHTGGGSRDNIAQVRCEFKEEDTLALAKVFNAPFIVNSAYIAKSIRHTMHKMGKTTLLFEGGKSKFFNGEVIETGVRGTHNVMQHLGMQKGKPTTNGAPVLIQKSQWVRANYSGIFNSLATNGAMVSKGDILGYIYDPYGEFEKPIKAPFSGYIFCINKSPVVNKGNALYHMSVEVE